MLFVSCLGNPTESYDLAYDFEGFEQEISIPLYKQTQSAMDILSRSEAESTINTDENNFLSLAFSMEAASMRGDETIKLDSLNFPMPNPEVSVPHQLIPNLLPASSLSIKEGDVILRFLVGHPEDIDVVFTIDQISINGEPWSQEISIPFPGFIPTMIERRYSIADHDIDLSTGNFDVQYTAHNSANEDRLLGEVNVSFTEQKALKVFAQRLESFDFEPVESSFGISFFGNNNNDNLALNDVRLRLDIENSFGFPVNLENLQIAARNAEGTNAMLSSAMLQNISLDYPTMNEIGTSKSMSLTFDRDNSNLNDLLNVGPDSLYLSFQARTQNNTNAIDPFFALDSSQIKANLELEIPLEFSIESYMYTDEQPFDLSFETLPEFEGHQMHIEDLKLQLHVENGLPLRMNVQYYFLDAQEQVLDSLFSAGSQQIGAANLDDDFQVISSSEWMFEEAVSADRLEQIQNATSLQASYTLNSGMVSNPVIKLFATDQVKFEIGTTALIRYE